MTTTKTIKSNRISVNGIEKNCGDCLVNSLHKELDRDYTTLATDTDTWVTRLYNRSRKYMYTSYKDYLENHTDFSLPAYITLKQSDFDTNPVTDLSLPNSTYKGGTLRIVSSCYLVLAEDIIVNFNSGNDYFPTTDQQTELVANIPGANYNQTYIYPVEQATGSYDLGFFASMTIETDNVVLDLNNKTLKMHNELYLMQRFFALIELASSPFIPRQGPGDFGTTVSYANYCKIMNGTIGLTSHHSIHGNNNNNIIISNVTMNNFEVAGIGLNDGDNIIIENCTIGPSFNDVPIKGHFAYVVNAERKLKEIKGSDSNLIALYNTAQSITSNILNTYKSTATAAAVYAADSELGNSGGLSVGLIYGILINKRGVAVNGISACTLADVQGEEYSKNIYIKSTTVKDIKSKPREVVTLETNDTAYLMGFGQVFRFDDMVNTTVGADYGKPVSTTLNDFIFDLMDEINAQGLSAEFAPINMHTKTWLIDWYDSGSGSTSIYDSIGSGSDKEANYLLNADSMNHVQKGSFGIRIQGTYQMLVDNCTVKNISNEGDNGSTLLGDYTKSHTLAVLERYGGNVCRGIGISAAYKVVVKDSIVKRILSFTGPSYGIDVISSQTSVYVNQNEVSEVLSKSVDVVDGNRYPEAQLITKVSN